MKKLILLLCVSLSVTATYAQQFHMNGRFSNTTPDVNAQIDSAAFIFSNTNYSYYIDDNPNPSSFGTYEIIIGTMADTIVFYEDNLGVCSDNGTGATVKFEIVKTVTPYYAITLSETSHSMANCASHSLQMSGDFIADDGIIFNWPASVNDAKEDIGLQAYTAGDKLLMTSNYNEKILVSIINLNGQKMMKTQEVFTTKGQKNIFSLSTLSPGIYFVRIQSEHGYKTLRVSI